MGKRRTTCEIQCQIHGMRPAKPQGDAKFIYVGLTGRHRKQRWGCPVCKKEAAAAAVAQAHEPQLEPA